MQEVTHETILTTVKSRVFTLDVLRGIAILGILIPNIVAFGLPGAMAIEAPGSQTYGTDAWVEVLRAVFCSGKFRGMLSILFGVGLAMQYAKLSSSNDEWPSRYLRRTVILLLIGLAHFLFIWYGDILFIYSIAALFSIAFVKVEDKFLIIAAGVLLGCSIFFGYGLGALTLLGVDLAPDNSGGLFSYLTEDFEMVAYASGSWFDQLMHRFVAFLSMTMMLQYVIPEIVGGFLIGMFLGRHGVLAAPSEHRRIRNSSLLIGLGIGGAMSVLPLLGYLGGLQYNFAIAIEMGGGVLLGLGYVMLGAVILEKYKDGALARPFANVGRFALSCYVMQSVVLTAVFYSWGGGYYGKFSVTELLGFVIATWILILIAASVWSRYFRFGPIEWLWRSQVYKERLAIRKAPRSSSSFSA